MQKPDFYYENRLWNEGYYLVIGVDEVGRGALAGPVVAGAAGLFLCRHYILSYLSLLGINDSKKISQKKRENLVPEINKYFYCGIGQASVAEINRFGIVKATERAMKRAIKQLIARSNKSKIPNPKKSQNSIFQNTKQTPFILIDGFEVKYISGIGIKNQKAIIRGDEKSISIAAASIIAKVYRDGLMRKLAKKYPKYHWEENKGYGTEKHREAIIKFGISKQHRRNFVSKW